MLQGTLTDAVRLHRAGLQLLHTDTAATIQVGRHLTKVTDVVVISHIKNIQSLQILSKRNFDSLSLSNRFLKSNWLVHEHVSC